MGYYNFSLDLAKAEKAEKDAACLLIQVANAEILKFEKTKDFDIKARVKGKELLFEVKDDYMSEKTGNIAIEFKSRGKYSGIETTKANYYIYKINKKNGKDYYYIASVDTIRNIIQKGLYYRIVTGGDKGSNTMCYLFKENIFGRYFKKYTLEKEN
jgi:hypothetical protein